MLSILLLAIEDEGAEVEVLARVLTSRSDDRLLTQLRTLGRLLEIEPPRLLVCAACGQERMVSGDWSGVCPACLSSAVRPLISI
jgi:predicted Zn-ribbon and HTH transcriptional regulator